jgi:uncharacterized protein YcnI
MYELRAGARRLAVVTVSAGATLLLSVAQAQAHAAVSPPVAKSRTLQQFSLSVPTEKENVTTSKIELTVPTGFTIDSYEPSPGWQRSLVRSGTGTNAVTTKVTWTGGKTPTEEDSVFRFNANASGEQTYTFKVTQTYSDGSVVNWSGAEGSDAPAPRVRAVSQLGGGGSSTIGVIALIVAVLAIVLGAIGLATGRRPLT